MYIVEVGKNMATTLPSFLQVSSKKTNLAQSLEAVVLVYNDSQMI